MRNWGTALAGLLTGTGLVLASLILAQAALDIKTHERSVTVKGLSEREVEADVGIWPVTYSRAADDLKKLFADLQADTDKVSAFLTQEGFEQNELSVSAPQIVDRQAQGYGAASERGLRYTGNATITVYSKRIEQILGTMQSLVRLGEQGVAVTGQSFQGRTEFLYTRLEDLKPAMVEEATRNAREVAEKFAAHSDSRLGAIKRASQGQFSITNRDSNTPHIKRVRVVSTIEYYLRD